MQTVRALASADLGTERRGAAVFFDVLGFGVIRWPVAWTVMLAIAALALVIAAVAVLVRSGATRYGSLALGAFAWLAMVLGAGAAGLLLRFVLADRGGLSAHLLVGSRAGELSLPAALLPFVVAALVWAPLLLVLDIGLGVAAYPVVAALAGLVATGLAPMIATAHRLARYGLITAASLLALAAAEVALTSPAATANASRTVNVRFVQEAAGHRCTRQAMPNQCAGRGRSTRAGAPLAGVRPRRRLAGPADHRAGAGADESPRISQDAGLESLAFRGRPGSRPGGPWRRARPG